MARKSAAKKARIAAWQLQQQQAAIAARDAEYQHQRRAYEAQQVQAMFDEVGAGAQYNHQSTTRPPPLYIGMPSPGVTHESSVSTSKNTRTVNTGMHPARAQLIASTTPAAATSFTSAASSHTPIPLAQPATPSKKQAKPASSPSRSAKKQKTKKQRQHEHQLMMKEHAKRRKIKQQEHLLRKQFAQQQMVNARLKQCAPQDATAAAAAPASTEECDSHDSDSDDDEDDVSEAQSKQSSEPEPDAEDDSASSDDDMPPLEPDEAYRWRDPLPIWPVEQANLTSSSHHSTVSTPTAAQIQQPSAASSVSSIIPTFSNAWYTGGLFICVVCGAANDRLVKIDSGNTLKAHLHSERHGKTVRRLQLQHKTVDAAKQHILTCSQRLPRFVSMPTDDAYWHYALTVLPPLTAGPGQNILAAPAPTTTAAPPVTAPMIASSTHAVQTQLPSPQHSDVRRQLDATLAESQHNQSMTASLHAITASSNDFAAYLAQFTGTADPAVTASSTPTSTSNHNNRQYAMDANSGLARPHVDVVASMYDTFDRHMQETTPSLPPHTPSRHLLHIVDTTSSASLGATTPVQSLTPLNGAVEALRRTYSPRVAAPPALPSPTSATPNAATTPTSPAGKVYASKLTSADETRLAALRAKLLSKKRALLAQTTTAATNGETQHDVTQATTLSLPATPTSATAALVLATAAVTPSSASQMFLSQLQPLAVPTDTSAQITPAAATVHRPMPVRPQTYRHTADTSKPFIVYVGSGSDSEDTDELVGDDRSVASSPTNDGFQIPRGLNHGLSAPRAKPRPSTSPTNQLTHIQSAQEVANKLMRQRELQNMKQRLAEMEEKRRRDNTSSTTAAASPITSTTVVTSPTSQSHATSASVTSPPPLTSISPLPANIASPSPTQIGPNGKQTSSDLPNSSTVALITPLQPTASKSAIDRITAFNPSAAPAVLQTLATSHLKRLQRQFAVRHTQAKRLKRTVTSLQQQLKRANNELQRNEKDAQRLSQQVMQQLMHCDMVKQGTATTSVPSIVTSAVMLDTTATPPPQSNGHKSANAVPQNAATALRERLLLREKAKLAIRLKQRQLGTKSTIVASTLPRKQVTATSKFVQCMSALFSLRSYALSPAFVGNFNTHLAMHLNRNPHIVICRYELRTGHCRRADCRHQHYFKPSGVELQQAVVRDIQQNKIEYDARSEEVQAVVTGNQATAGVPNGVANAESTTTLRTVINDLRSHVGSQSAVLVYAVARHLAKQQASSQPHASTVRLTRSSVHRADVDISLTQYSDYSSDEGEGHDGVVDDRSDQSTTTKSQLDQQPDSSMGFISQFADDIIDLDMLPSSDDEHTPNAADPTTADGIAVSHGHVEVSATALDTNMQTSEDAVSAALDSSPVDLSPLSDDDDFLPLDVGSDMDGEYGGEEGQAPAMQFVGAVQS